MLPISICTPSRLSVTIRALLFAMPLLIVPSRAQQTWTPPPPQCEDCDVSNCAPPNACDWQGKCSPLTCSSNADCPGQEYCDCYSFCSNLGGNGDSCPCGDSGCSGSLACVNGSCTDCSNDCNDSSCPGYDLCTCNPSDPSCSGGSWGDDDDDDDDDNPCWW